MRKPISAPIPFSATSHEIGLDDLPADAAIEVLRIQAANALDQTRRAELGQYFTSLSIGRLMASMFANADEIHLLDAGAGSGSLFAAFVMEFARRTEPPRCINVTACELEPIILDHLRQTATICGEVADAASIDFAAEIRQVDFIGESLRSLDKGLFAGVVPKTFTHAILNPPYAKIRASSAVRRALRRIGVEAGNMYIAFLALVTELLRPNGELVAITPRSFCNGPYFRSFRRWFLQRMAIDRVHVFESRSAAFRADEVLQENIIFHAVKSGMPPAMVTITTSTGDGDGTETERISDYVSVVRPNDPDSFIHIIPDEWGNQVADTIERFQPRLKDLELSVSTGRVVDFRSRELLRDMPSENTIPLIYPGHFNGGYIEWPRAALKKPNALASSRRTDDLALPPGVYVLVRRVSAKEEQRRIVAAVYDSDRVSPLPVAFENHLNYYHRDNGGLPGLLARGLAAYLNSTLVDHYFRHFSGHTQVNATDLRRLPYPERSQLERLGARIDEERFPSQRELDDLVREELLTMGNDSDPVLVKNRIDEALVVLKAIGMPQGQLNERSALTLLALLDLRPDTAWSKASSPLRGITPIMDFVREHYGKSYAPNSRETFRRYTMHQFLDAAIVVANPDDPDRPVNSPDFVYQVELSALELFRGFGSDSWDHDLTTFLASRQTLRAKYAQDREMRRVAIKMPDGVTLNLTPGTHNILIKKIIEDFCPRFTPGGTPLYVGDTGEKFAFVDHDALRSLGVTVDPERKMPDVLVYHQDRDWLVIIEAVTSHGPVNPKRHGELKALFSACSAGLVFVTAFLSRQAMIGYLSEISWETEVWTAEDPSHMIHFNGERFLGPY